MIRLLVWFVRCKKESLAVLRDFTFFTGKSNGSETFCTIFPYKFFIFPIFSEFLEYIGMVNVRLLQTVLFKKDSVFDALF